MSPVSAALTLVGITSASFIGLYIVSVVAGWYLTVYKNKHLPNPGLKPTPFVGHTFHIPEHGGVHLLLKAWAKLYDAFPLYLGQRMIFMVQDPEIMQTAAIKQYKDFPNRGPLWSSPLAIGTVGRLRYVTEQSLLMTTNDGWKSIRGQSRVIFTKEGLIKFLPQIRAGSKLTTQTILQEGSGGQEVDVQAAVGRMSLRNSLMLSTGVDVHAPGENGSDPKWQAKVDRLCQSAEDFFNAPVLSFFASNFMALLPLWMHPYASVIPFQIAALFQTQERRLAEARRFSTNVMVAQVNRTRRALGHPIKFPVSDEKYAIGDPAEGCLIHVLAKAINSDTKKPFGDIDIAAHALTMVLGGQDSTQTAISFTLHLLAKHPACQEKCAKEAAAVDAEAIDSLQEFKSKMPYTLACFKEAMRMYPPFHLVTRQAVRESQVGPYRIPKHSWIGCNIIGMHYNENIYPQPEQFRPERFLPGPEMKNRHDIAFLPFGIGIRDCIGKDYAYLASLLFLAVFLKSVKVELDPSKLNQPMKLNFGTLTLKPGAGIWLKTSPRKA